METTKTRIPLAEARGLAQEVLTLIGPACHRAEIAGSIRRQRPDVGDIEILAVPRLEPFLDVFGEPIPNHENNVLDTMIDGVLKNHPEQWGMRLSKVGQRAVGSKYKRLTYRGVALDLFCVIHPGQWGALMVIRTGPADFSHRLVTDRRQGGLMPPWLKERQGALWNGDELVPTPTEESFFAALGIPYIAPADRV